MVGQTMNLKPNSYHQYENQKAREVQSISFRGYYFSTRDFPISALLCLFTS